MSDMLSQMLAMYARPTQMGVNPSTAAAQEALAKSNQIMQQQRALRDQLVSSASGGPPGMGSPTGIPPNAGGQSGKSGGGMQPMTGAQMSDGSAGGASAKSGIGQSLGL